MAEIQKHTEEARAPERDISDLTRQVDELIPILAHEFAQEIEDRGLRGKIQLHAVAGNVWSVGTSRDNTYGIPNVITYPEEYLASTDLRVINARLRHEIGNLNYPFERQLTELAKWARDQGIPPQVVTTLAQAIHGPSVDYLEMRNSHSSAPQDNFRALYETEINATSIVESVENRSPYRQAIDITFLVGLFVSRVISADLLQRALQDAAPNVRDIFTREFVEQIEDAVKTSNPRRKAAMIRDTLFPRLSPLVTFDDFVEDSSFEPEPLEDGREVSEEQTSAEQIEDDALSGAISPEVAAQMQQVREQVQRLREQMQKRSDHSSHQDQTERQRKQHSQQREVSPEEQLEQEEAKDLLEESLRERLQDIKDQIQQQSQQPSTDWQEVSPQSMQEIADQAQQIQEQLKQDAQQQSGQTDQQMSEQLEKLQEQLQQLQEVAQQFSEDHQAQDEEAEDEEPMTYNIKEYGIEESQLSPEQLELLEKVRTYAHKTSKTYRTAMRILMTAYQEHNPNFTDEIIQKMIDRGYDLPDFSIYSPDAAQQFLAQHPELGIDTIHDETFLVNFNLPRPIGRMWYRGGSGSRSIAVPEGAIEWGEFYRRTMPVIWNAADRAVVTDKLYLDRLNQFGQHDAKKYYYLYEAVNVPTMDDETDQANQPIDQSDETEFEPQDGQPSEDGQQQEAPGDESDDKQSQQGQQGEQNVQASPSGQPSSNEKDGMSGEAQASQQDGQDADIQGEQPGQGGMGSMSPQEMQDLMQQVQQMLEEARRQEGQQGSQLGQESMSQMQDLQQLMEQLQELQKQIGQQNGQQGLGGQEEGEEQQSGKSEEAQGDEGQSEGSGDSDSQSKGEPQEQGHDTFQPGGSSNQRTVKDLFAQKSKLARELGELSDSLTSKFATQEDSSFSLKETDPELATQLVERQKERLQASQRAQIGELERIKEKQQNELQSYYQELTGLSGEALSLYIEYIAEMQEFIDEVTDYFVERFDLDQDYQMTRDLLHGSRLQNAWQRNILGSLEGKPVLRPNSFERRLNPEKPTIIWTLIIDNSGSCGGETIEQEKKLAVALIEVAKKLDIPLEILTFGANEGFVFLKTHDQEVLGDELARTVLLEADQGTPDVATLEAACASMLKYSDQYRTPHSFIYFMTDGQSGGNNRTIEDVIADYRRDMVITGIGLGPASGTIQVTWGKNALPVPEVSRLSQQFLDKIEEQIEETFDL